MSIKMISIAWPLSRQTHTTKRGKMGSSSPPLDLQFDLPLQLSKRIFLENSAKWIFRTPTENLSCAMAFTSGFCKKLYIRVGLS